jgi:hypothetical protein
MALDRRMLPLSASSRTINSDSAEALTNGGCADWPQPLLPLGALLLPRRSDTEGRYARLVVEYGKNCPSLWMQGREACKRPLQLPKSGRRGRSSRWFNC